MNVNRFWRKLVIIVALTLTLAVQGALAAGGGTGNIMGSLENQSSASYTVTATDEATGRSRDVTVDTDGGFRFSQLPVGAYVLSVSRDGTVVALDTFNVELNGTTTARFPLSDSNLEEIIVTASADTHDTYATDSGLVLGEQDIDVMPVPRNITAVSLLAPGVILGDSKFGPGGFASFGGSSIAENSCYINGLEVTNTSQGLGCGEVPFEFYEQFQVKTGGYSAQYGRTTGGVLNAVTKSGGNEWEFGVGAAVEPKSLYEEGQVSRGNQGAGPVFRDSTKDEFGLFEYWVTASGPIIKDKLFAYAIVNPRDLDYNHSNYIGTSQNNPDTEYNEIEASGSGNLFWGAKIDWDITDYHRLSAWGYSNRSDFIDTHYPKDPVTNEISSTPSAVFTYMRGGEAMAMSYTGTFFDAVTVSAMFGEIETQYTNVPDDTESCPAISDTRVAPLQNPVTIIQGCGPGGNYGDNVDTNQQLRLDVEWAVGDHLIRAGLDQQDRDTLHLSQPIGGAYWTYFTLAPNATIQGTAGTLFTNTTGAPLEIASSNIFSNADAGGQFTSELTAYYVEDEWSITDNIVLYLGARQDSMTNTGGTGVVFADFDQDWAPRLGLSWDPVGDGQHKIYSTWGRYYLPVFNNTSFRVAAGISDTWTFYTYTGVDSVIGAPTGNVGVNGNDANSTVIYSVSTAPTQQQFQAQEAHPFYKDELIVGYEHYFGDNDALSIRYVNREVGATLDDYCGPYANAFFCTLVNPGSGGTWEDTDGVVRYHSAAQLKLPEGDNTYNSVQLQWDHSGDRTNYTAMYVWAQSLGNFEGAVKSDIQQADAGITQDFDFPALMDGAYGYLPNDRRHVFKFFGNFGITDSLIAGWSASAASGRPLNMFGQGYPDDAADVYGAYGDTFYLFTNQCPDTNLNGACEQSEKVYEKSTRDAGGRTPWTFTLDASLTYNFELAGVELQNSLQVFNVLDIQEATSINEHVEESEGTLNQWYGSVYTWQQPRHVRLSVQARFH